MINRILIRIKVLQIVYAFYQNENGDLKVAEKELLFALKKSYDLYHYYLLLLIEITLLHERQLDNRKHKLRPTEEDLNPNMKLVNNRFIAQLSRNQELQQYASENSLSWDNERDFVKTMLDQLLASDLYAEYVASKANSYADDQEFWRAYFKKNICGNPLVEEYLEDKSIYWNDDIDIIATFTLKTIRKFEEQNGITQPLLPMFKDEEDREFAVRLFRQTLLKGDEIRVRLNRHMKNWESERVANMDLYIMQTAIAEILSFPTIPVSVSLNEYIDAAKYYSTPKSGTFINGILDAVVTELKKEKVLFKD